MDHTAMLSQIEDMQKAGAIFTDVDIHHDPTKDLWRVDCNGLMEKIEEISSPPIFSTAKPISGKLKETITDNIKFSEAIDLEKESTKKRKLEPHVCNVDVLKPSHAAVVCGSCEKVTMWLEPWEVPINWHDDVKKRITRLTEEQVGVCNEFYEFRKQVKQESALLSHSVTKMQHESESVQEMIAELKILKERVKKLENLADDSHFLDKPY